MFVLRDAMTASLLLQPEDPVATAAKPRPIVVPKSTKTPPSVPGGRFKPATKLELAKAVDLEIKGTAEYELTGPDNADRRTHRKKAVDLLKQAREIYDAALEEDSASSDLERRLKELG